MGNFIIDNDVIIVAESEISAISTASGFSPADVMNLAKLKRRWRMDSADKSDSVAVMIFDLSSAQTVDAIVLDDVNFDNVIIAGHDSDMSEESSSGFDEWATADFSSGTVTISKDNQVGRYKVYIPLTNFNYQFLAILIPTTASSVGSYTTKWEIGRVAILDTATELTQNPDYGMKRGGKSQYTSHIQKSGSEERVSHGVIRWEATLPFGVRRLTNETELLAINNYDISGTVIIYLNNGDTSEVYVCLRDTSYEGTWQFPDGVKGNVIKFKERV